MATREENVRLTVTGDFTSEMTRAAAAAALLEHNLNSLNGTAIRSSRGTTTITRDTDALTKSMDKGRSSIDQYSGRLSLLANLAGAIGPSLIPIAAVGVPAVAGLAAQFGFAALAGGTMIGAFQGVGDALTAMNKASLEPTAENLQAAKMAMEEISPAAQDMVTQLRHMGPAMKELRDTGASEMFPGFVEGLQSMETLLPTVRRIVGAVAGELGSIGADTGASLASDRWADFFTFLETDAPSALRDMAAAAGNTGHAMAEMWMAFDPLNDDFSSWLVDATASLDEWASGLSKTEGFAEFIDYIRTTGPQVADTLGAIGSAALQIVEAAAPIAGPILQGIEAFAKAIGAIADSDLGTPIFGMVAALSALNLAMRTTSALSKTAFTGPVATGIRNQSAGLKTLRADWMAYSAVTRTAQGRAQASATQMIAHREAAERLGGSLRSTAAQAGKAGAVVGGLALATSGLGDKVGVTNTVSLALMGTLAGPWGAAIGAGVGAVIDLSHANDGLSDSLHRASAAANASDWTAFSENIAKAKDEVKDLNDVTSGGDWFSDAFKGLGAAMPGGDLSGGIFSDVTLSGKASAGVLANSFAGAFDTIQSRTAAAAIAVTAASRGFSVTGDAAAEAAMSVKELTAAMERANAAMNAISSEDALRTATLNARDLAKEGGKVLAANGKILAAHQRAGISARAALVGMGTAAQQAGQKMKAGFGKTKFLDEKRRDFVRIAQAMGMSRPAAQRMANDFGLIDRLHAKPKVTEQGAAESKKRIADMRAEINRLKNKLIHVDQEGANAVRAQIAAVQRELQQLKDRTVHIRVQTQHIKSGDLGAGGAVSPQSARGNIFHYAYGDVANRHMPELAGPGPTRVWREPETMGEAYIPLANDDRRPRARAIAAETVSLLGGVAYFANGGIDDGSRRRRGGGNDHEHVNRFTKALKEATKALNREKTLRESLISKRTDLSSTVRDSFLSDPFATPTDVWAKGAGDPRAVLRADIAKANAFRGTLMKLKGSGLDGQALAAIASTGDVAKAQSLLSLGRSGINQYESLYNQRAQAAALVGTYAGGAVYNEQISETNKELRQLRAEIIHLRRGQRGNAREMGREAGRSVGGEINRTAAQARRRNR